MSPRQYVWAGLACAVAVVTTLVLTLMGSLEVAKARVLQSAEVPTTPHLLLSGLRTGLLTFSGWMTNAQFLDGLALSGILLAPLVIFVIFIGYLGGGVAGALAMTAGMFLPAFAFTLVGHDLMEQVDERPSVHAALDGVAAGIVGLIAATVLQLFLATVTEPAQGGDLPGGPRGRLSVEGQVGRAGDCRWCRAPGALATGLGGV
jgi:chromate transporter